MIILVLGFWPSWCRFFCTSDVCGFVWEATWRGINTVNHVQRLILIGVFLPMCVL